MKNTLKYKLISLLMAAVPAIGAVSCSGEDGPDTTAPELVVKTNPVAAAGGSQFVSVTASGQWKLTVECNPAGDWAKFSTESGSGDADVVLTVEPNEAAGSRTARITLISGSWRKEITLTQKGSAGNSGGSEGGDENGGSTSGGNLKQTGWLELPALATPQGSSQYDFFYHNMTVNSETVRNYSFSWDYDNLVAPWVAYPLNKGLIGSGSRTDDAWALDPLLPESKQPVLYSGFNKGSMSVKIDRGHQIPSADRLTYNANVQTFYGTNMTPQIGEKFNQGIWANLETMVRSWANTSDTLYVVTGCVTAGSKNYALDNVGKKITVPTAYYKALLRYKKDATIGTKGYVACAVWLDHMEYSSQVITSSYVMSIDALEEKLGIDLFVNLSGVIGESDAAAVEAEDPKTQKWWGFN